MPLIIQKAWFTENQILSNPATLFCFGDNEQRIGNGGQAKPCRGKPNVIGIRTKAKPKTSYDAYWYDSTFRSNIIKVIGDFDVVETSLIANEEVRFPADGFGTGLALLNKNAPRTLQFIGDYTNYIIEKYNGTYE